MADIGNYAPDVDLFDLDAVFDCESFNRLFNDEDLANLTSDNEVKDPIPPPIGFVHASREIPPPTGYVSWSGDGTTGNLVSLGEATAPAPPSNHVPPPSTGYVSWSGDGIVDANNPINDPMMWSLYNESDQVNSLHVPSTTPAPNENEEEGHSDNADFGGPSLPLPSWPPSPDPFRCSCCQVLRELVHTNGTITTKLEIHGRIGFIFHAILEIRNKINSSLHTPDYHMFDFSTRSMKQVKQFLLQYCRERKVSGFVKVQDPFSGFYEAICVGMEIENNAANAKADGFFNLSVTASAGDDQTVHVRAENGTTNRPKTTLAAAQRRRGKEQQR